MKRKKKNEEDEDEEEEECCDLSNLELAMWLSSRSQIWYRARPDGFGEKHVLIEKEDLPHLCTCRTTPSKVLASLVYALRSRVTKLVSTVRGTPINKRQKKRSGDELLALSAPFGQHVYRDVVVEESLSGNDSQ
ncbi:hypothetical protein P7K49_025538 [Saguinus oedipus]|uniref:Uncharacterized protein n=1 Tax=Saguinus oedipus TaxID=9490 RepID=A0ABQ9UI69_SAGOE|nr:hypothetical protein P7K49_025538 [Saguinus oedipus]